MMANFSIYRTLIIMWRQVHTSAVMCKTVNKQAKVMAKLMVGSHRKRKNWCHTETVARSPVLPSSKEFQSGSTSKRRVDVLNKLFMSSITELLATGEVASHLIGHGVSITRVKVTSDFSAVNVYWAAKNIKDNTEMDKILVDAGFELRHNLCQLHILGNVPRICFVADRWQMALENTLQSLEEARLKDGYVTIDPATEMKSENILEMTLEPEILARINNLEEEIEDNPLPPMTHNVLGLDHSAIMIKIERAVKKSEAKHRQNDDSSVTYTEPNLVESSVEECNFRSSDITQYIAKQKIQKKKAMRAFKKEILVDVDSFDKPSEEEYVDAEDGDFIEEFEDIMKNNHRT